jgi:hypothetical protein
LKYEIKYQALQKVFVMRAQQLSHNAKRSLAKGVIAGIGTLAAYLIVVIVTTPNLPPEFAVGAAFGLNSIVMGGVAGAVGAQVFFSSYGKSLGCEIKRKKTIMGAGTGGTAIGSFFSFFSLVAVGCCGSWLVLLSLLPAVLGGTLSVVLIDYSLPLSYASLALVMGFAALAGIKLQRRLKKNGRV